MEFLNAEKAEKKERPVRVLQYGEGNFLRAFADYMFDVANEKGVFDGDIVIVKPRNLGSLEKFKKQDSCYTVCFRGIKNGKPGISKRVVTAVKETLSAYDDYGRYMAYAHLDTLRFIVSNTTEAGIVYDEKDRLEDMPQQTYPGKLCRFLYERYVFFSGAADKGLIVLPVELIDNNGTELKKCVMKHAEKWGLTHAFMKWLDESCIFASTLVDRIVPGFPKDEAEKLFNEWGYRDDLAVTAEPYGLWIIESEKDISKELPLKEAGMDIVFTDDLKPYKKRKVRILNGAHTSFVPASFLAGNDYVRQSMEDDDISSFMKKTLFDEIIPALVESEKRPEGTLSGESECKERPEGIPAGESECKEKTEGVFSGESESGEGRTEFVNVTNSEKEASVEKDNASASFEDECRQFAEDVITRFMNPYVKHMHMSIALNSVSKWRTRCLPSLLDYVKYFGKLPVCLTFSLAALMELYTGNEVKDGFLICHRGSEEYRISDDAAVLDFFAKHSQEQPESFVNALFEREDFFGIRPDEIPGFADAVTENLKRIRQEGSRNVIRVFLSDYE